MKKKQYLPMLMLGLIVTGATGGGIVLLRDFLATDTVPAKKVVQEIRIIRPAAATAGSRTPTAAAT